MQDERAPVADEAVDTTPARHVNASRRAVCLAGAWVLSGCAAPRANGTAQSAESTATRELSPTGKSGWPSIWATPSWRPEGLRASHGAYR